MYETFFGLRARPFALTPDPAYLYLGRPHRLAVSLLEYALQQGSGFTLVSGEIGSGKTTIIQYALRHVGKELRIGLLTNVHPGMGALLPWIIQALGLRPSERMDSVELYDAFTRVLQREHQNGRHVVLIVDEAQNLTADALEELRVLSNVNTGERFLLQTILVGQPELRATLREKRMRQLAQRIAIDYHIGPLQREETHAYIRHRLCVAGGDQDLIVSGARELVHDHSLGVPRLINQICDTALVYGYGEQTETIGTQIIEQVLQDRGQGGVLPLGAAALPGSQPVVSI